MREERRELSELLLKAGVSITIANYASTAIAAVGSIIAARLLGSEGYGLVTVSLFIPMLAASLAGLSLGGIVSSILASGGASSRKRVLASSLLLVLASSAILSSIQILASPKLASMLGRPEISLYLVILAPYVLGVSLLGLSQAVLNGLGLFYVSAILNSAATVFRVFLSIALIVAGYGVLGFLLGQSTALFVFGILGVMVAYRAVGGLEAPSLSTHVLLLSKSMPLHFANTVSMGVDGVKTGLLYRVALDSEIGNLALASRLALPLNYVVNAFQTATLVAVSGKEEPKALESFKLIVRNTSIVVTLLAGFLIFSADIAVFLLFGQDFYLAPIYYYFIMAPALLSPLGYYLAGSFLTARGRTLVLSRVSIALSLATLPLFAALTIVAGVYGFLVAQIASSAAAALAYGLLVWGRGFRAVLRESLELLTPVLSSFVIGLSVKLVVPGIWGSLFSLTAYTITALAVAPLVVESRSLYELRELLEEHRPLGLLAARALDFYLRVVESLWGRLA